MTHPEDTSMKGIKGSDRCDARARRARQGISPVIATVILIAIAVIIGVAVAAYAGGLFGTQSTTGGIMMSALTLNVDDPANPTVLEVSMVITNQGTRADEIVSVSIPGVGNVSAGNITPTTFACEPGADDFPTVPGNNTCTLEFSSSTLLGTLQPGQTATVQVNFKSGAMSTRVATIGP
ncbi:MAG: archaellin/type IV pilin N-terminal domain-containing protein [Candidatus Nitrosocaldus sp.]